MEKLIQVLKVLVLTRQALNLPRIESLNCVQMRLKLMVTLFQKEAFSKFLACVSHVTAYQHFLRLHFHVKLPRIL